MMSGSPGVSGRGIAIKPAMIRIDPVTTLAAWTMLSIESRYPYPPPRKPPRRFLSWVGSGPRHDIAAAEPLQVAGGSPGWRVAGRVALNGKPETGINAAVMIHSQVPGLGHQVPGSGVQHQVQVQARTRTRTRTPVPDTR